MPTESRKPLIVISYAHADEPENPAEGEVKWLSFVIGYLRPAIKQGAVELWLDRRMLGGSDWRPEIEQKLRACDIFLLLVSRHSLSSDYVVDKEIAIIRERQAKDEAVHFYPLILTPTPEIALDLVRDKNLRPRDGKPLSTYPGNERLLIMAEVADEIVVIAAKVERRISGIEPKSTVEGSDADDDPPNAHGVPYQRLQRWLRTAPWEADVAIAARAALRAIPLTQAISRGLLEREAENLVPTMIAGAFYASAIARVVANYPACANEFGDAAETIGFTILFAENKARAASHKAVIAAKYAAKSAVDRRASERARQAVANAAGAAVESAVEQGSYAAHTAYYAAQAAYYADFAERGKMESAAYYSALSVEYAAKACEAAASDAGVLWSEVLVDLGSVERNSAAALNDRPLWSLGRPEWVADAWTKLQTALPKDQGWEVWFVWYTERERGVPRNEAYDRAFATTRQEKEGFAEMNDRIKVRVTMAE